MKIVSFVIVIALGSNCRYVIIRGQYNSPKWELSGGIAQGAIVRGPIVLGGNCPGGNCPGGNYPRGNDMIRALLKRHLIQTCSFLVLECCLHFSENFLYGVLLRDFFVTK